MWTLHVRLSAIAAAILLLSLTNQLAFARGSQAGHDDPWNSDHIDRWPPEVRSDVTRMCGNAARAAHYFATYLDNSRLIKLHFEHLHCDERAQFCRGTSCLHQEYISTGGRYRLMRNYYGRNND